MYGVSVEVQTHDILFMAEKPRSTSFSDRTIIEESDLMQQSAQRMIFKADVDQESYRQKPEIALELN